MKNTPSIRIVALTLFCLIIAAWAAPAPAAAQDSSPPTVACAHTLIPLMERVAKALAESDPPQEISLREIDTAQGVQGLLAGETALAAVTRALTPLEEAQARGKGLHLISQRVGTDCLLAVVHPANPVFDLTLAELTGIFSGRLRSWRQVGGKDKSILVVVRPPSSGAAQIWQAKALDNTPPRQDASEQETHEGVIQAVAGNKGAIGYVSLGFLDPSVKALSLGGINPGLANVKSGRYPVCRPLMLVATGQPQGPVKAALDLLAGAQGQEMVRELGFLPLK